MHNLVLDATPFADGCWTNWKTHPERRSKAERIPAPRSLYRYSPHQPVAQCLLRVSQLSSDHLFLRYIVVLHICHCTIACCLLAKGMCAWLYCIRCVILHGSPRACISSGRGTGYSYVRVSSYPNVEQGSSGQTSVIRRVMCSALLSWRIPLREEPSLPSRDAPGAGFWQGGILGSIPGIALQLVTWS